MYTVQCTVCNVHRAGCSCKKNPHSFYLSIYISFFSLSLTLSLSLSLSLSLPLYFSLIPQSIRSRDSEDSGSIEIVEKMAVLFERSRSPEKSDVIVYRNTSPLQEVHSLSLPASHNLSLHLPHFLSLPPSPSPSLPFSPSIFISLTPSISLTPFLSLHIRIPHSLSLPPSPSPFYILYYLVFKLVSSFERDSS